MNPSHKQLTAFLETTNTYLDLTDFSKCIAYLECPEGSRIASIDYINSKDVCDTEIYIGEDKYTLTKKQQENVLNHLEREINDDYNTWQEMKNDTYNVYDDQNNY